MSSLIPSVAIWKPELFPTALMFSPPKPHRPMSVVGDHDNESKDTSAHSTHSTNNNNGPIAMDDSDLLSWQQSTTDHSSKLKVQLDMMIRDKDRDAELITALRQELGGVTGRLAATVSEHREQRNQWLHEKVELESRNCQLLALHTQLQARNIKKEKDYEKLQVTLLLNSCCLLSLNVGVLPYVGLIVFGVLF